ncbi:MAG: aminotransferase class V-fold PLP-dependent enzyme [Armatimonadetes bacterium]|nr:aminotransferase class V-fold PLP-dependent enzyme [Armatimonadota bacterium]
MLSRRKFLATAATVAFADHALAVVERASERTSVGAGTAQDEEFWAQIQQAFTLDRSIVNFNNGGVCPSPRVVQDAMRRQLEYSNQAPSYTMWRHLEPEIEHVRRRLARTFGCDAEEVAITRNASEALETCLMGFDLEPGDEVLTTDQDYPRMVTTIQARERRHGIKMVQVPVPAAPRSKKEIVDAFTSGLTPKTKMVLVSQVVFMTGQINPVHDVVELGRRHGVPVIVDGAHAFAQYPFTWKELGCDYYGTSLHKWLMAPVGTGMLAVRKDKIEKLWPLMAAGSTQDKDVRKFEEIGTHPAANHNAIAEALTFHEMIGAGRKADRLRYLRSRWTDVLREEKNVVFHTNLDPQFSCGLTTVQIKGVPPGDLAAWLLEKKGIFVTGIGHPSFEGIRVTPNVYTTLDEIDRFREAMLEAARQGIA